MSDASKPYNPHTNRGRKRTDADAPSKRSGQMREVQRAHRERKKAYVVGLEERVKELEARFGSGTTPTSTAQPASLVSGHTGARNEYIRGLESMAASLKDENRNLRLKLATFDVHFGLEGGNGGQDEYEGVDDVLGLGFGDGGVAGGGRGVCVDPGCTAERMKVLALEGRILLLENDLDKSRKECMELKERLGSEGPAGMDTTNSTLSLGMFDELDMYLERLDGTEGYEDTNIPPPPEVETSRLALKALPSLRNSGATVDRLAQMVQVRIVTLSKLQLFLADDAIYNTVDGSREYANVQETEESASTQVASV
ncbi:hypothetical protein BCR33DRAFT_740528 [Rhizoclosmatium globosum]|uniref:BZIP domain-containing protein n=1 Tax=Rhizoclosmatium globosum TaxID=329046 RepID=A0A1Y2BYG0_9FUNG|nr:hypothetical protein BCR33DRAFT_740528 [Rhizoclosmatium globosum]|eukprot:ORY39812.1 hypothetical protein BCR33DRAFT_740528 [Rhizoclosmatium globosum]